MTEDHPNLLQPKPRRAFDLTPNSSDSSLPNTPSGQPTDSSRLEVENEKHINHNKSILNLTSSTLFGIYTPSASGLDTRGDEPSTPSGNGSLTPGRGSLEDNRPPVIGAFERRQLRRSDSYSHQSRFWRTVVPLGERVILLFCFGVAYGVIISHLHDTQQVAPVQLEGIRHSSWKYLIGWGGVGVVLGGLLPWVDTFWEEILGNDNAMIMGRSKAIDRRRPSKTGADEDERPASLAGSGSGADWNPVVRSIGAFVGIAFAIVSGRAHVIDIKLTRAIAQAPMAINIASVLDSRTSESRPMVSC